MSDEPLETQVAVLRKESEQHHELVMEVRTRLNSIEKLAHETNNRLAAMKTCPMPGACVPLQTLVEHHDNRIRSLEDSRLAARASGKVIAALLVGSGALSSLIGVAISKLWK